MKWFKRAVAAGYGEDFAKEVAETASVVFEAGLDEPISRRYVAIHLKLLENRMKRQMKEMEARIMDKLDSLTL